MASRGAAEARRAAAQVWQLIGSAEHCQNRSSPCPPCPSAPLPLCVKKSMPIQVWDADGRGKGLSNVGVFPLTGRTTISRLKGKKNGARGGTRTPTGCPTSTSSLRVCQFHHPSTFNKNDANILPLLPGKCNLFFERPGKCPWTASSSVGMNRLSKHGLHGHNREASSHSPDVFSRFAPYHDTAPCS